MKRRSMKRILIPYFAFKTACLIFATVVLAWGWFGFETWFESFLIAALLTFTADLFFIWREARRKRSA